MVTCSVTTMRTNTCAESAAIATIHQVRRATAGFAGSHGYPSNLAACLHLQLQRCALLFQNPLRYRNQQPTAPVSLLGRTSLDLIRPPQPPNAGNPRRMYLAMLPTTSCSCSTVHAPDWCTCAACCFAISAAARLLPRITQPAARHVRKTAAFGARAARALEHPAGGGLPAPSPTPVKTCAYHLIKVAD